MAQIGTIGLETANGTVQVPVYELGDFGSDVYDVVRVQTPSGVGAIPFVNPSDAAHNYLRVQTQNYGVLAAHNESSLYSPSMWDFEDGNVNEWSNSDDGSFQADSSVSYGGNYSARYYMPPGQLYTVSRTDANIESPSEIHIAFRWDNNITTGSDDTGDDNEIEFFIGPPNSEYGYYYTIATFSSNDNGVFDLIHGGTNTTVTGTVPTHTWVTFSLRNIDWSAETFDAYYNGTQKTSGTFFESGSYFAGIRLRNETHASQSERNIWIDKIEVVK